jgi:hypothetical protein
LHFAGTGSGAAATVFTTKLLANKHGLATRVGRHTELYHVSGKAVYVALDEPDNRHRRRRSPLAIKAKLMALDYVLAHPQDTFLATERERVAYFTDRWQIDRQVLPAKQYRGPRSETIRFFVDKYPIAIARGTDPTADGPTFCYIDPGEASLGGFDTYLQQYERLWLALPAARVVYVGDHHGSAPGAQVIFERFWRRTGAREASLTDRLLAYFHVRAVYERRMPGAISKEMLDRVRDGRAEFAGPRIDALFERWCREGDASIRATSEAEDRSIRARAITLSTWVAEHHYDVFGTVWHSPPARNPAADAPHG